MEHDFNYHIDFYHIKKFYYFDPYALLLSIAINIHELLMTAFVLQGHINVIFLFL